MAATNAPSTSVENEGRLNSDSRNKPKTTTDNDGGDEESPFPQPLYYCKDGRPKFGITPPTAFAFSYPHPPLPSNLAKNRILRPVDEQSKESLQEGITEAEKIFEKEAMPLPGLALVEGVPLPKVLIPEIELALYWDRHPYEFRSTEDNIKANMNSGNSLIKSKSEMNLASKVGEVLKETRSSNRSSRSFSVNGVASSNTGSKKSHKSNKSSRSRASSASSLKDLSQDKELPSRNTHNHHHHQSNSNNNQREQSASLPPGGNNDHVKSTNGGGNHCTNGNCNSNKNSANNDNRNHRKPMQMSESERRKFDDIKLFHRQNDSRAGHNQGQGPPKLIRSHEQFEQMRNGKKSEGVQVALEDVTAAALKSTYLCPLHGQYRRGVERRDKSGFRTDMSSLTNVHAFCSRALKGRTSKTKLIKTAETQTDDEIPSTGKFPVPDEPSSRVKRSKTAGHTRGVGSKGKDMMASEYHGSFKNPYKIAESEKRHLRNKILNYCFSKHSIF